MKIKNIRLKDIATKQSKIYIRLDKSLLVNILKKASKNEKPHRDKKFCGKIGVYFNKKIKASPTVIAWIRFNRAIPLSKLLIIKKLSGYSWKSIEENTIGLKSNLSGREVYITFPLKIEREIGSIVGHVLGDGSIDKRYNQVFYSNSNKGLLEKFSYHMKKVFKIEPRIWAQMTSNFEGKTRWEKRLKEINELKKDRNCGLFYPTICGVLLNIIFDNFSIGKNKKITDKIKKTNKNFKMGLIRAFFDDEGTVGEKSIRVFQDRKDILIDIRDFLKEFDISTKEVKKYVKREKDRYYLDIHRKSNLIKFRDKIGFTSSKKMNKLKEISVIKNYKNSK